MTTASIDHHPLASHYQTYLQALRESYQPSGNSDTKQVTAWLTQLCKEMLERKQLFKVVYHVLVDQTLPREVKQAACNSVSLALYSNPSIENLSEVFEELLSLIKSEDISQQLSGTLTQFSLKAILSQHLSSKTAEIGNYVLMQMYSGLESSKTMEITRRLVEMVPVIFEEFDGSDLFEFLRDHNHLNLLSTFGKNYSERVSAMFVQLNKLTVEELSVRDLSKECVFVDTLKGIIEFFQTILNQLYSFEDLHDDVVFTLNDTVSFNDFIKALMQLNLKSSAQIICTTPLPIHSVLNDMKSEMSTVAEAVFQKCPDIFRLCFNTLFSHSNATYRDRNVENILANVMVLLERMSLERKYEQFLVEQRPSFCLVLLNYCVANEEEIEYMETDAEFFIEFGNEFCEEQDNCYPKIKAASLLSSLCLNIDGMLSMVVQTSIIMLDDILMKEEERHNNYKSILKNYEAFPFSKLETTSRIEAILLVLACLSDQIEKRQALKKVMISFLSFRFRRLIQHPSDLVKCRTLMLTGYFPCKEYLDSYLHLLRENKSKVIKEQIIHTYRKLVNRGSSTQEIKFWIMDTGFKMLNVLSSLDTLFEQIILNNPDLTDDDDKLIHIFQRLVADTVAQFQPLKKDSLTNVNRLINTLTTLINRIPRIKTFEEIFIPVFQQMLQSKDTEQSILQLAWALIARMREITPIQEQLLQPLISIIKNNNFVLNNAVEIFNLHLTYGSKQSQMIVKILTSALEHTLRNTTDIRMEDVVEILSLLELYLIQPQAQEQTFNMVYPGLIGILALNIPQAVKNRVTETIISGFYKHPEATFHLLSSIYPNLLSSLIHQSKGHLFTPRFRKTHNIYVMCLAELEAKRSNGAASQLVETVLQLFEAFQVSTETEKRERVSEQQSIYTCKDSLKIAVLMKEKNLKHPLDEVDEFVFFREKIGNMVRSGGVEVLGALDRSLVSKYCEQRRVQNSTRRIYKVKRRQM